LKGSEIKITKKGDKLILEPLARSRWPKEFWNVFTDDPDFKTPDPLPTKPFDLD
jgi:virulence-associated protein VagC